jgi:hypothetical protein
MTHAVRPVILLLWLGLAIVARAQAASQAASGGPGAATVSCEEAAQQGYTVAHVATRGVRPRSALPIAEGDRLSVERLSAARDEFAKQFEEQQDRATYRFRFQLFTMSCLAGNANDRFVDVEFRADDVGIPQGDSAGSVIDEADIDRLDVLRDASTVGARWIRDPRLGDVFGFEAQLRPDSEGQLMPVGRLNVEHPNVAFDGWKARNSPFYSFGLSSALTSTLNTTGFYNVGNFGAWTKNLPFADGATSSKGVRLGAGWQWQYGRADLHLQATYSVAKVDFDAPGVSQAPHWRNSVKLSAGQEFLGHGRFARIGGWFDAGGGTRGGAFTRVFQDFALPSVSTNVDLTVSFGRAGESVDFDRRFVGGNRLDPFLADKGSSVEELAWTGPILRGHGASDFYVPRENYVTADSSAYANFSLTWGLPGWRKPVVEAIDVRERDIVLEAVQKEYDLAVVTLIQENVRRGMSGKRAKERSELEARELRQALHNLMVHAHRSIVSPLVTLDGGWLTERGFTRHAIDGGAGVRIQRPRVSIEILYTKPMTDNLIGYSRSARWLVRFSARKGFNVS